LKKSNLDNELTFESAMKELESLVNEIDNDKISLNDITDVFERGTFLMNFCNKELSKVENKIYKLNKSKDGIKVEKWMFFVQETLIKASLFQL